MKEAEFNTEKDNLLQSFIFDDFYKSFSKDSKIVPRLELDITPDCNKKCEYCYLQKYKDQLYPKDIRDRDNILKNLQILLDHLNNYKLKIRQIQLFSGEIWGSDFSFKVLDMLLKNNIQNITKSIIIPSNCSFVNNKDSLDKINQYVIKFLLKGVRLAFSVSYDGLIVEQQNRPFNSDKEEFYGENYSNKLFEFVDTMNIGFHPMIAACSIEKQIENFDWWAEQCNKYNWNVLDKVMMLEVRNNDWTEEKIVSYIKWLKHVTDYAYNTVAMSNDMEMIKILFGSNEKVSTHYQPFTLPSHKGKISCNLVHHLTIRLGDLAIIPCHRLSYDKLIYGKYKVLDNKIVGIEALNINFCFQNYLLHNSGYLKCDTCEINKVCSGQCHGACFENSQEAFYPIECVCLLEKVKVLFNLMYLEKIVRDSNIFENNNLHDMKNIKKAVEENLSILSKLRTLKEYEKWIILIQNMI